MVKLQEAKPFACMREIRQKFRHVDINILSPARDARKNLYQPQKYIYGNVRKRTTQSYKCRGDIPPRKTAVPLKIYSAACLL